MLQIGITFLFGICDVPALPSGWVTVKTPNDFVVVTAPDGAKYLVGDGVLYPWKICPDEGLPNSTLRPGQRYVETRAARKITNL